MRFRQVGVCYLDFRKMYDLGNHRLLLTKLESFGILRQIYQWMKVFLPGEHFASG